jgi:hypothetical protein
VLLHRVASRISHTCSVVFMIMRFPLRVLAIGGVEAGSGKGGRHAWCSLRGLFSPHQLACSAVISVRRNFKEYRRAQAGRLEKSMRSNDVRFAAASTLRAWNGIHGIAHGRGVEKASQHSSLRHRHLLEV